MINNIVKISLIIGLILTAAKENITKGQSHNERVTIVGSFQPQIGDFSKINIEPGTEQAEFRKAELRYTFIDRMAETKTEIENIPALVVVPDRSTDIFNNYFRFGFGSLITPSVLFRHHSEVADRTAFSLGMRHLSTWTNIPEYAPSDFMTNSINLGLRRGTANHSFYGGIEYQNDQLRYYGFKPDDYGITVEKDDIRQAYSTIGFVAGLESRYDDISSLHHNAVISFNRRANRDETAENHMNLKADARKDMQLFPNQGKQFIELGAGLDFYGYGDSLASSNSSMFTLSPTVGLSGDFFKLRAGVKFNAAFGDSSETQLAPDVSANLYLLENALNIYATLGGGIRRNGFSMLSKENPFISPVVDLAWEKTPLDFKAGMRAALIKNLDLHVAVYYASVEQMALFVTDTLSVWDNTFAVVYDKVGHFAFLADAAYQLNQSVGLQGELAVNSYSPENQQRAWHKPSFTFKAGADIRPVERLVLAASLKFEGNRYAPVWKSGLLTEHELKPWLDLNVGAEYAISEQFTVFAELNNMLGTRYERFYNYPVQGLQLFGGVSFRF
jgi:hypothetical protein